MRIKRDLAFAAVGGLVVAAGVLLVKQPVQVKQSEVATPPTPIMETSTHDTKAHPTQAGPASADPDQRSSSADTASGSYLECRMGMSPQGAGTGQMSGESQGIHGKVWQSGENVRLETGTAMGSRTTIVNSSGTYVLLPSQKTAIKTPSDSQIQAKGVRTFSLLSFLNQFDQTRQQLENVRNVGTEEVLGIDCDIWAATLPMPRPSTSFVPTVEETKRFEGTMRFWVAKSKTPPFPLKALVTSTSSRTVNGLFTVTKLELGQPIPASLFAIPEGYTIKETSTEPASRTSTKADTGIQAFDTVLP